MFYILVIISAIIGIIIGRNVPVIPYSYSAYISVSIIAIFDTILIALASITKNKFSIRSFLGDFFGNILLSILLVYIGSKLNIDIFLALIFVFVNRIFNNLSILREHYFEKMEIKYKNIKKNYIELKSKKDITKEENKINKI